jgi:hypothetical protein
MKTVQEVYEHYHIMPSLQMHQLRVGAVAKTICDNLMREVDTRVVILACLFHDMGNIIKSDLTTFPDFVEPEGVAHWEMLKDDFVARYGRNEHAATAAIAGEIGLPKTVMGIIADISFSKLEKTRDSNSYELKIAEYSDLRVGPHGVLSLDARVTEAAGRYVGKHPDMPRSAEEFERLVAAIHTVEQQIFSEADITPEDITEQSVQPLVPELREYTVA